MGQHRKTHTVRHRNGWRYQRDVPADLIGTVGRKTWRKWFGSVSKPEAELRGRELAVEHDKLIVRLRNLSVEDRDYLNQVGFDHLPQHIENMERMAGFYEQLGSVVSVDHFTVQEAAQGKAALLLLRGQKGVRETKTDITKAKTFLDSTNDGDTLIGTWREASKPRRRTSIGRMERYLSKFREHLGRDDLLSVSKDDVLNYVAALERRTDLTHLTKTKYLAALNTIYRVAAGKKLVPFNPCADVKVQKPNGAKFVDQVAPKGFEPAQIRVILDNLDGEPNDFAWVVKLLAYHGARSGEICQLRTEDVTSLRGIPVLRIHDRHEVIKNLPSVRDIPIHPECIGIVEYAATKRGPWLFDFPAWGQGRAGKFQQLGSKFLRNECEIAAPWVMHDLRHAWKTAAREIGMPENVSKAIMGHSMGKDAAAGYGEPPSLRVRAEWIAKIDPLD
ncbi:MAG: tyrosine-type recombinase/integrase [Hyphomicrobiaceae bacterium]